VDTCRLCGQRGKLVASHILPEFFYSDLYDEKHRHVAVTSEGMGRARFAQKGIRERLLCELCDGKIGRFESYGATLLRRLDVALAANPRGVALEDVDLTTFRLFGLSLLWRMHVATHHMFKAVHLGSRAAQLRSMIVAAKPGDPEDFGFALAKLTGLDLHGTLIMAPIARRMRTHRAYILMAGGYDWVFIGSRPTSDLRQYMPCVGLTDTLCVPSIAQDRARLFSNLQKAFPKALGRALV
jgi:hypothetical protein